MVLGVGARAGNVVSRFPLSPGARALECASFFHPGRKLVPRAAPAAVWGNPDTAPFPFGIEPVSYTVWILHPKSTHWNLLFPGGAKLSFPTPVLEQTETAQRPSIRPLFQTEKSPWRFGRTRPGPSPGILFYITRNPARNQAGIPRKRRYP